MDLYLTINLTENLQKARLKRKKDRLMQEEASKLTKIKGFIEAFKSNDMEERIIMETELLHEYKALRARITDLRHKRSKFLTINTHMHA